MASQDMAEVVPLFRDERKPQSQVSFAFTNERMEDGRWNRLLSILFTDHSADAEEQQAA